MSRDKERYVMGPAPTQPELPDPTVRDEALAQCRAAIEIGKIRIKERAKT